MQVMLSDLGGFGLVCDWPQGGMNIFSPLLSSSSSFCLLFSSLFDFSFFFFFPYLSRNLSTFQSAIKMEFTFVYPGDRDGKRRDQEGPRGDQGRRQSKKGGGEGGLQDGTVVSQDQQQSNKKKKETNTKYWNRDVGR